MEALDDNAFSHFLHSESFEVEQTETSGDLNPQSVFLTRHTGVRVFEVICMDNGAEMSLCGLLYYRRYCLFTHAPTKLTPKKESF